MRQHTASSTTQITLSFSHHRHSFPILFLSFSYPPLSFSHPFLILFILFSYPFLILSTSFFLSFHYPCLILFYCLLIIFLSFPFPVLAARNIYIKEMYQQNSSNINKYQRKSTNTNRNQ